MALLFVARGPIDLPATAARFPGSVRYLQLDNSLVPGPLPPRWTAVTVDDLGTLEELRREYLGHLEAIADAPVGALGSIDTLFRRRDGHSLWWTDPALRRSPNRGMYVLLKAVWLVTKSIERFRPSRVVIHTTDRRDAAVLFRAAHAAAEVVFAPGSAIPGLLPMVDLDRWRRESLAYADEFLRHRRARSRAVGGLPRLMGPRVVLSTLFPRHLGTRDGKPEVEYWKLLVDRLTGLKPAYLLDLDPPDAWPLNFDFEYLTKHAPTLAALPDALPMWAAPLGTLTALRMRMHQRGLIRRYVRAERDPGFRKMFAFRGVDVSSEWIVELRHAVSMAIRYEADVEAAATAMRAAGDVKLVLVHQEFEPRGMAQIAAARRLGLSTLGVQHGTFYPLHTIYTPSAAQIARTPTPDRYAVYGEFAKDVVSRFGAYPADKVDIAAGSRFDALASSPPDRAAARANLGIPSEAFVILVTTQTYPWFPAAVQVTVRAAPADALVCIKTFPAERTKYEVMAPAVFTDRFDTLLAACDVLVSASSTTVLEATLAGKPTVCLNFSAEEFYYPYVEEGVSIGARNESEVSTALATLRTFVPDAAWHDRRMTFLRRHLGPAADGHAAETMASLVERLATASSH